MNVHLLMKLPKFLLASIFLSSHFEDAQDAVERQLIQI